jgi:hypothetical protein
MQDYTSLPPTIQLHLTMTQLCCMFQSLNKLCHRVLAQAYVVSGVSYELGGMTLTKHKSSFPTQKPGANNITSTSCFVPLMLTRWNQPGGSTLDGLAVATRSDIIYFGHQQSDGSVLVHRLACRSMYTVLLPWMRRCGRNSSLCLQSADTNECQYTSKSRHVVS